MKNALKRIVPLLLVIAVLASAVWYLFVYDRDFARDVLLSQARYFESAGNHTISTWLYDQAYRYNDNDDTVAIELAEQYKASGNYTKAEYTLSKAITNGGSTELYIALCQTYVEQDKLLDAVNMLATVSNPTIKQELDAMRPAVPTVSQNPGFYSQYITVEVSAEGSALYVSTDGEYPSVNEDAYTGSISLPQGETTIYALAVSENGLVSPLGLYGYTIGGVIEPVTFADAAIEAEVRSLLDLEADAIVYTNDLWNITEFTVPQDAQVYDDIGRMTFLTSLTIQNAVSDELDCISSLTQLQKLFITGCSLDQNTLAAIGSLANLKELTLVRCSLSDISALSTAQSLEYLDLNYNSIGDISVLSGMAELKALYLSHNALTDLSALGGLSKLETLDVSYNSLTSVAPVCTVVSLQDLDVSNNLLTHLSALDNLTDLTVLNASHNALTTIEVLSSCSALTELNISDNQLSDISSLADLTALRELDFSYNSVATLPNWPASTAIVILDGSYNCISDLLPLAQLQNLNRLNLDYNSDITSADALADCYNLMEVNLFGTKVTNVDALTQQSIVVHYNPTEVNVEITEPTEPETQPGESEPQ